MLDRNIDRRTFMTTVGRRGAGIGLAAGSLPTLLAACTSDTPTVATTTPTGASPTSSSAPAGTAIVSDVVDFSLDPDGWAGAFGWVTMRLHEAVVGGEAAYFIRTDTSDETFATEEGLVYVPKLAGLAAAELTADAWLIDGATTVLSAAPGERNYTPAWSLHRATWKGTPGEVSSADEVRAAEEAGDLEVEDLQVVLNGPVIVWPGGGMPVDPDLTEYLGGGQLIDPPDTAALQVTFKLHECFPASRYIVCDTSLEPMAEGMLVASSPALAGAPEAGATGRTNVFMGGVEGSGPMGGQPSVFDTSAGDPAWSPYWDHYTYAWSEGASPEVLSSQDAVWAARDAGDLDEFPGTPETDGAVFTVNCPVPVVAPNTFAA